MLLFMYHHSFLDICSCFYSFDIQLHTNDFFILSSLLVLLDNKSVMKRSGPGLYIILTLCWCILGSICCSLCNNVASSFLNVATVACSLQLYSPPLESSYDSIFPGFVIYLIPLFLNCCISSLCWRDFCLQL